MLVKMTCPQCGATMDMDDSKDFMFCSFCGAKVANVAEKVELSGKVQIDESGKIDNFFSVAETAMKSGNYAEAYAYYLRILETVPNSPKALLFKGLCGVAQSSVGNVRMQEGIQSVQDYAAGESASPAMLKEFLSKAEAVTDKQFEAYCSDARKKTFPSLDDVRLYFDFIDGLVKFRAAVASSVTDDAMIQDKALEDAKRAFIPSTIEMVRYAQNRVTYVVGYTTKIDKKGNVTNEENTKKTNTLNEKELCDIIDSLKEQYNSLPSTVSTLKTFDEEIEKNRAVVDEFENSLKEFFVTRPELEKPYRHPGLFGRAKKRAAVEAEFGEELLNKKTLSELAEKSIKEAQGNRKAFSRKNLI